MNQDLRQTKIDSGGDSQFWDEQDMQVLGLSKYGLELDKIMGKVKDMINFWQNDNSLCAASESFFREKKSTLGFPVFGFTFILR